MKPLDFLWNNFGCHLLAAEGPTAEGLERVFRMSHEIYARSGNSSTSRLGSSSWAIVRPGGTSLGFSLKAPPDSISLSQVSYHTAFIDELVAWDGSSPRVFMIFQKKPMPLANVFLSLDRRHVRICSPNGVETFDLDASASGLSSKFHRQWRAYVESCQ